ncbi:acyl carrier protein [Kibdelosporangium banguiense]|uniref:Acyl carrier protein n=1 Tax=Kibdelosporangium banguiense TaxID=1365924 RepID=A0ABS4TVV2_9PSEU|nr:phosphopantetheine-binding protein [Kibdelosporangium banguiense]MBP2328546.1 acyl carrier protein [Kibdelosporangium banguiense]
MASLSEISGVLGRHPGVEQADTVIVCLDGQELVVAVVELREYWSGPVLRDYVNQQFGVAALAGVLVVETLPMVDGTVDAGYVEAAIADGRCTLYAHPRDEVESRLAAIWAELIELPSVGVHDDFLELGGDSLSALGIISAIEAEFDRSLDVYEFMNASCVRRLADLLRADASLVSTERE